MTTKIPVELSSTPSIVDNGDATAITIDSSENVGIGTTSPSMKVNISHGDQDGLRFNCANTAESFIDFGDTDNDAIGRISYDHADDSMSFRASASEYLKLTAQGTLNFPTPTAFSDTNAQIAHHSNNYFYVIGGSAGNVIQDNSGGSNRILLRDSNTIEFEVNGSERMRIDSSGHVMVGTTNVNVATQNSDLGVVLSPNGRIFATGDGHTDLNITSDGQIMRFRSGASAEGNISISGALVSYNGFSGTHESSGIASDTAIGTVCSTIDELDTYVSGTKEGQTRTDHPKIKVSDAQGDSRVYGVLSSYSEEDNKPIVASVGIGSVLVTGACAGGDLLESNGDGTAKVQDDDIIRSKTIGKVTIGNSDTNVKLVSCVLYCG